MKIKPLYIYLIAFVAFVVAIIIFSNNSNTTEDKSNLPQDDIHQNMMNEDQSPSKSNVMASAVEQLEELRKSYEKNPNDTLVIREYADMLTMSHKYDEAIEMYIKILKVDSNRIDAHLQLTFVYFNKGDLEKALEYTKNILAIDKEHQIANFNYGAIEAAKGNSSKAKEIWQLLIKKYPKSDIAHIAEQSLKQLETSINQK